MRRLVIFSRRDAIFSSSLLLLGSVRAGNIFRCIQLGRRLATSSPAGNQLCRSCPFYSLVWYPWTMCSKGRMATTGQRRNMMKGNHKIYGQVPGIDLFGPHHHLQREATSKAHSDAFIQRIHPEKNVQKIKVYNLHSLIYIVQGALNLQPMFQLKGGRETTSG